LNFKLSIIIGLTFCFQSLEAQDIKFCFQTGYGFYNMSSLKKITKESFEKLPFEAKIISNYPPYHYYQPMIKFSIENFDFGFIYLFQTTGSRISSKDYSGEYRFDSKINCNSPGIIINGIIKDYNILKIALVLQTGVNISVLKMNEYLRIDPLTNTTDQKFTAISFYFEPGINLIYPWNHINFELNIGYKKEMFRNDFSLKGADQNSIPVKKDFIDPDIWDGLRLGITISYTLMKKKL